MLAGMLELLRTCTRDRIVVVSNYTQTLDLVSQVGCCHQLPDWCGCMADRQLLGSVQRGHQLHGHRWSGARRCPSRAALPSTPCSAGQRCTWCPTALPAACAAHGMDGPAAFTVVPPSPAAVPPLPQLCRDRGYPFVRLDGSTTIKKRNKLVGGAVR